MAKLIILTGASGTLGKYFTSLLLKEKDIEIIALTNEKERLKKKTNTKIKYVSRSGFPTNIELQRYIFEVSKQMEVFFFNLGFPRTSDVSQLANTLQNYEEILKIIIKLEIKTVINISSQSVYNQFDGVIEKESNTIDPNGTYGLAKYMSERLTELYLKNTKIEYKNIRLGSLISEEFSERIVNRFIRDIFDGKEISIETGGEKMSYLYTQDAAECLLQIIKQYKKLRNNVYNLGSNENFTTKELIEKVSSVINIDVKVNETVKETNFSNAIDSSKLFNELSWIPKIDMNQIILKLVQEEMRNRL